MLARAKPKHIARPSDLLPYGLIMFNKKMLDWAHVYSRRSMSYATYLQRCSCSAVQARTGLDPC